MCLCFCLCNDFVLWDFSGIIWFLYTDTVPKLEESFVILHITPVLFHLTVRQAINFLSKRDITDAWQRDVSAAGKKRILA